MNAILDIHKTFPYIIILLLSKDENDCGVF